jgi:Ca2+-binding EF-hand superfamily protein
MKSNCVSSKSSSYLPNPCILSLPFKTTVALKTNTKTSVVTVDQMINDPNIFLNQLYCGVQTTLQRKQRVAKRNFKSLNESMFVPLNTMGRNYEKKGSVREITRTNSKSSLYDPDKTRSDIEEIMNSNETTKSLLKKLNHKRITADDFPKILRILLEDIDEKEKLIEGFRNVIKTNTSTITNLVLKMQVSNKEIETLKKQLDETLNQVKYSKEKTNTIKLLNEKKAFTNKILNNPLEEAIKLLRHNTAHELLQSLEEINKRLPETTYFVSEVTKLVRQSTSRVESLEDILTVIKGWASERNECGKILLLRNNLCKVLYEGNKEVTDKEIVMFVIKSIGKCGN